MRARLTLVPVVVSALVLSACAVSPPMVDIEASPTPGPCDAAFEALLVASPAERDELVRASLDDCSLEAWHLQNATLQPELPVERISEPDQQLALLCADQRWAATAVCAEAGG